MLHVEHSAILSTFIKLPFVIKIFVLSISEWLLKTGFTVYILILSPDYGLAHMFCKDATFAFCMIHHYVVVSLYFFCSICCLLAQLLTLKGFSRRNLSREYEIL